MSNSNHNRIARYFFPVCRRSAKKLGNDRIKNSRENHLLVNAKHRKKQLF
jgi:hypothetical protein